MIRTMRQFVFQPLGVCLETGWTTARRKSSFVLPATSGMSSFGSQVKATKIERYFLSWHRHLYDTLGLYHGLASANHERDVIELPAGGRPHAAEAAGRPEGSSPSPLDWKATPR